MKPAWWRWATAVLLWAMACPKVKAQAVVDTMMIHHLEGIADTTTIEHGRCIAGGFYGDTLIVGPAFETPWLVGKQLPNTVEWRWWECPHGTVALWHNHPWNVEMGPPVTRCFLSSPDQSILLTPTAPPIMIVSVRREVSCFFLRIRPGEWKRVPFQRR